MRREKQVLVEMSESSFGDLKWKDLGNNPANLVNHVPIFDRMNTIYRINKDGLYVEVSHVERVVFDKLPSRLDRVAH